MPYDIAATSVPELGPYDSGNPRVLEQHARWIAESGAGAINVSWWGRGDYGIGKDAPDGRDARPRPEGHVSSRTLLGRSLDSYVSDIQYLVTELR